MKTINLNFLFQDLIVSYAHLITSRPQTKNELAENLKNTYSLSNPRNELFYQSILKSEFGTIRLCKITNSILFN